MSYHFPAYLYRLRSIRRWSLMRSTAAENVAEHSFHVALLAHLLCEIGNAKYAENPQFARHRRKLGVLRFSGRIPLRLLMLAVHNLSAVDMQDLTAHIRRVIGGEEHVSRGQLLRLAGTLHRRRSSEFGHLLLIER